MSGSKPPLIENATRVLAQFAATLRFDDIPREAVERIKLSVLDSIGCCLFGATLPWTRKVAALAEAEEAQPVAALMGMGKKSSVALAVLVNGTAGHAFGRSRGLSVAATGRRAWPRRHCGSGARPR